MGKRMNQIEKYFTLARKQALKGDCKNAIRRYRLGAVGVRSDGAVVVSSNVPTRQPARNAHAEARLTKKLNFGSRVYVVRVTARGSLGLARPCRQCQAAMRLRGVSRCYYSISDKEYGVIEW